ncbi:DUF3325 domain-containing protein [Diaphorobacter sp. HDW4B]|uniref:DUF3325 domain-containing protein n=1 Tax=Diaphorobacter sp. HDW4B TaxID=2714925 RepID=UPI001407EDD6|nr:DUF3325 domain-containing protein [Diaphorobacter sp. HDW4B]QIL72805.1 DUF3325 domain-containing protein [Diaphorobacter sp. HDW4B]
MTELHAGLVVLALAWGGMTALAFAMDRHHEQLTGKRSMASSRAISLRGAGAFMLLLSAVPSILVWGSTVGFVAWLGFVSAGALLAVAGIGANARWTLRGVLLALLASVVSLVWF